MFIIGEKINGAIPSVAEAIKKRDADFVRDLALKQVDAGINYLDICAGTKPTEEYDALCWLIDVVQGTTDTPICIDSPDPNMIKSVFPRISQAGIINSVSDEGNKCDILFPLLQNTDWQVIALTCNNDGIPADADTRVHIASELIDKAAGYDISPERLHIDPLVMSLATVSKAMMIFMEAVTRIKTVYPTVKIAAGLSNISYGLPVRKLINQNFLTLALSVGLDTGILDPLNRDLYGTLLAAEALLDKDKHCRKYNNACRTGRIGSIKKIKKEGK
ncbi:methyltetrahydrofolate--corrinoid methyltransferase [Desulfosarcina ovata subsp. sediminis]|uniref:Methyltetrahydrofolate--corrinoid methyltransferase n=1 Tax=Desulfosarcina ovata subsp. sediminis TaxID=885957 RepID=A0A5K7ZIG1_9BACT|nr:methyltetrahydrofolate cobalamin methyltransferase [Desulfosarcina ovata]BBO81912.1 methyltetrahydrofolate--corrinoid methyltransferase [Desulfosarcina ovata subsp. sediminis]